MNASDHDEANKEEHFDAIKANLEFGPAFDAGFDLSQAFLIAVVAIAALEEEIGLRIEVFDQKVNSHEQQKLENHKFINWPAVSLID